MPYADPERQREFQRNQLRERRDRWIEENGPCAHCLSTEDLEIDHIDPDMKELKISGFWSRRAEIRERELAKCQVLCVDCHKAKTAKDWANRRELLHGVKTTPYKYGCRCRPCRDLKARLMREWRARRNQGSEA